MIFKIILGFACINIIMCLDNGLGLTPQMGWSTWYAYGCNINQTIIKKTADLLVSTGLSQKGYKYVNLDDCWQISRNQITKQIIQDKSNFPSGIKNLANYVHSKGLKFGLYSDAGEKTCQGRPGGYSYQKVDAKTYAQWGVDYLKYDNCYNLNVSGKIRYFVMQKALNETNRHIFYSMCNWGQQRSWEWAGPYANSWRTTGDIRDNWKSFTSVLDQQVGLQVYAGKGGWNDPDILQVGIGGMTNQQYQAQFAFWAILKAPLIIGCSLQNISPETLNILSNQELIAINQDPLGIQASRIRKDVKTDGTSQVWGGQLADNRYIVVFFNRGQMTTSIKVNIKQQLKKSFDTYSIRNIISHKDQGIKSDIQLTASVNKHSVQVLVLKFYKVGQAPQDTTIKSQIQTISSPIKQTIKQINQGVPSTPVSKQNEKLKIQQKTRNDKNQKQIINSVPETDHKNPKINLSQLKEPEVKQLNVKKKISQLQKLQNQNNIGQAQPKTTPGLKKQTN